MRLVEVAGPSHREDGAPLYIKNAFNTMGHPCVRKTVLEPPPWDGVEGCVEVDWAADAFPDLPELIPPAPSIIWNSDTHWSSKSYLYRLNHSKRFSHVYCAQRDAVENFAAQGLPVEWMPHAAEHTVYTPRLKDYATHLRANLPPDPDAFRHNMVVRHPAYDWCFVGFMNTDNRIKALEALCDGFPNAFVLSGMFFEETAKVFTDSRVVFNISVCGDLNMRSFETLATRSCLLTDRQQGMAEAGFVHKENCLIYDSLEEGMDLLDWALANQGERERIADAGWRMVLAKHTYQHRCQTMLDRFTVLRDTKGEVARL